MGSILVVDDDILILRTMAQLLEKEGYAVTCVNNGQDALAKIKETFYPLVILDVRMPGMDGMELLKNMRDIQTGDDRSVVIVVTGYADEDVPIRAIKLGASDYIMKPFDIAQLLYSVKRNIRLAQMEIEKKEYVKQIINKSKELEATLHELKKAKEDMEVYNRTLEQKVMERTAELKATQEQLIQSAKMAAVGQLGAGVAHELNNPLGGILGYAQFAMEKFRKPDLSLNDLKTCQSYVEYIERETIRCKKIVENLLKFSRLPFSSKLAPLEVGKAVEETIAVMERQLDINNVKVELQLSPDLAKVLGVVNQVEQVFTNLILNAQQAMPEGGTIKIIAENVTDEKTRRPTRVKISFSDTGCGIPAENIPRIFEPFFTTKGKGTGLGLSVSYQIIQEHSGTIDVKSKEGEGTVFVITLPVVA